MRAIDLTGRRFGRLVVMELAGRRTMSGRTRWAYRCLCDCGNQNIVMGKNLIAGNSNSCGCLKLDLCAQLTPDDKWFRGKISIDPDAGCWLWSGRIMRGGYGHGYGRKGMRTNCAHRLVYDRLVGPIPPGHDLDHLCRVRRCVNPDHLEPVTRSENLRRGLTGKHYRVRTECAKGHPLVGANVIHGVRKGHVAADGKPVDFATRLCRICANARKRTRRLLARTGAQT